MILLVEISNIAAPLFACNDKYNRMNSDPATIKNTV